MGTITLPFTSGKIHGWEEELLLGNPNDRKNTFRGYAININLPGGKEYDPKLTLL